MVSGQKKIPKTSSLQTCLLVLDWPLFIPVCTETLVLRAYTPPYYPTTLVFYTFCLKMPGSCCSGGDNSYAPPCSLGFLHTTREKEKLVKFNANCMLTYEHIKH